MARETEHRASGPVGALIRQERLRQGISQQALCHGICAVSYLSKIEHGTAACGEEIRRRLLGRLGVEYIRDEKLLAGLDRAYRKVLHRLEEDGFLRLWDWQGDAALYQRLRPSSRCVEATLLSALEELTRTGETDLERVECLLPLPDGDSGRLYGAIRAMEFQGRGRPDLAAQALAQVEDAGRPWTCQGTGYYQFQSGRYRQARETLRRAYQGFADRGGALGMLDTAVLLAAVEANSLDTQAMLRWNRVAANLNRAVRDRQLECSLRYNLGAAYLMRGQLELGLKYLAQCEGLLAELGDGESGLYCLTQQKLAFAHAFQGDREAAKACLERLEERRPEGHLARAAQLIRYMVEHPDFLGQSAFCSLLEDCCRQAGQEAPSGFAQFYVYYLLETYRAQRQYRKAAALLREFVFPKQAGNERDRIKYSSDFPNRTGLNDAE